MLLLVVGAVLPGALLTILLVNRTYSRDRQTLEAGFVEAARVDAAALDREIGGTIRSLQILSSTPSLDNGDLVAFHTEATRVQQGMPTWYSVVLIDNRGQQLVSSRLPVGSPLLPVHERSSFERALASRQPVISPITTMERQELGYGFAVRVPIVRNGAVRYVLTAILPVERLASLVEPPIGSPYEAIRTIIDANGTIAARTYGADRFIGQPITSEIRARMEQHHEGVFQVISMDGEPVLSAIGESAYGWTTAITVPVTVLDAPFRATLALLTGGLLLVASGLVAVLFVSHRLTADLTSVARAAGEVAANRWVPPARAHVAEIQHVQDSLVATAALLTDRERERDEEMRRSERALAEAENANRTKDQFLAVLGHELRNPLAPALTALELMKAKNPGVFVREREVLERQVAHMVRLVDELLDVSRLARGKIELHRSTVNVGELVDRAVDMSRPLLARRSHELIVEIDAVRSVSIDADEGRVLQVITNLLSNAAKYTEPGGRVRVAGHVSGSILTLAIEDNGPGLSEDTLASIFEPFAQGPRTLDRAEGGLGLGLALVKSLLQLHGGTLSVEGREPEAGTRFIVQFPLPVRRAVQPEREADAVDWQRPVASRRVLLVDDNDDARETLRLALASVGHEVSTAANADLALLLATGHEFEIGILDIGLPGMNGYELAGVLRGRCPGIRLIALTGYGQAADAAAAVRAGFDVHCAKPIRLAALLAAICPDSANANVLS
jgi:signal transduction histidine kinase/ActR/RegA family two-component response regulator